MSSTEFMDTFRTALDLAAKRLKDAPGIDIAISDLREIAASPPSGRRTELFQPVLVSQRLGIPFSTVQSLAEELLRYRAFHLWVRVNCPNAGDELDRLIFETDDPEVFEQKLEEVCRHCGRIHDSPDWSCIEPVFGLNRNDVRSNMFEDSGFFVERPRLNAW